MKCTNKRIKFVLRITLVLCVIFLGTILLVAGFEYKHAHKPFASEYENSHYGKSVGQEKLIASDLCVTEDTDIPLDGMNVADDFHSAALFDLKHQKVLYSSKIFEELYPASTTKLMTALIVLKYGNLDDIVVVSSNATNFAYDEQVCGLQTGDQISMNDLLYGLLLYSGNDTAVAIAEHMSGSVEAFADLMNLEAQKLGASHSHFVNPHGLHDENHQTTAYDLYLIFNECCKDQRFLDIVSTKEYIGTITSTDGVVRTEEWQATNYYAQGYATAPDDVIVYGGKTGTTDEAGCCVILYEQDDSGNPYISIIMGASDKTVLYNDMTQLLKCGISDL